MENVSQVKAVDLHGLLHLQDVMRPLGEHDLSNRGKASLGSCECTVEVTISSASAINLGLPSGELLLGAIAVVITRDIWKRANTVPCASHGDFSLLTLLGGRWLPLHLPWAESCTGQRRERTAHVWPPPESPGTSEAPPCTSQRTDHHGRGYAHKLMVCQRVQ